MLVINKFKNLYIIFIKKVTQFIYTILTLLPIIPIFYSFALHVIYLSTIFLICIWNGANFYFDIFTETYSKRLEKYLRMELEKIKPNNSFSAIEKETINSPVPLSCSILSFSEPGLYKSKDILKEKVKHTTSDE